MCSINIQYRFLNLHIKQEMEGHVAHMGEMRNACKILVGKPEGKRPLSRPTHRWRIILKWILGK
jgi:hypothetical protein